jgi:S1-C subfamily serine protease
LLCLPAAAQQGSGLERSVVKIVNYTQRGIWYTPWDVSQVTPVLGSGFVIEGGQILTNAHVASDSRLMILFLHNDPDPHYAAVTHIAHDCDLALVRPEEPDLLNDVPPLRLGSLPELGSTVDTLGYPIGGTQLSSTRGVVSRIEAQSYIHSGIDQHVTVQTDAAINSGNSGGPVVQDGSVVGVAFQVIADLDNVGYFIPTEVIGRFLRDVEDGRYDGYPFLGVHTAGMENPAARRKAGMEERESGARIHLLYPESSAEGILRPGDVVLEVEGHQVANDGSVADGGLRFPFGMLIDRLQVGESVELRLLRDGERLDVSVPLLGYRLGDLRGHVYDRLPKYYIYGGLVFVALSFETVKTFGSEWAADGDRPLLYEFLFRPLDDLSLLSKERVVLLRRLTHPVNADMAWFRNQVVERVNGRTVYGLEDLVEAFEGHDGDYHFIEFSNFNRFGVLDRRGAEKANPEILNSYGIGEDRRL